MTRNHPPQRTYHYDRQGRLRARIAPEGITRWTWDGVRLVGVSDTNNPKATVTPPSDTTDCLWRLFE